MANFGNSNLNELLTFLSERIKEQGFHLKIKKNVFFEMVKLKKEKYNQFRNQIISEWKEFKKSRQGKLQKKTYTHFLYKNFNQYFSYFIEEFFALNYNKSLSLRSKEELSEENLILEYNYVLSKREIESFSNLSENLKGDRYNLSFPTAYLFFITAVFGIIIRKTIHEFLLISLEGANLKRIDSKGKNMTFLINVKSSKEDLYNNYYQMVLYYFLKQFKQIPERNYGELIKGQETLFQLALNEYDQVKIKERLLDLLYYFYKKCILLGNISPLLDFFNFVCSRVEDSIYSKIELIKKDFLANLDDYSNEKKNILIKLFTYLDRTSTLSGTFLANNLPSSKSQFNLFLLYKKYYFGSGLEALEVGDVLFLPEIFKNKLDNYNKTGNLVIDSNSIRNIATFLNYFAIIGNVKSMDIFFQKIFGKSLSELNYNFFINFFKSLNHNFLNLINTMKEDLSDTEKNGFNFNLVTEHICRMLYILIDDIFLRESPEEASRNFYDPRGRYIPKNIALRVLELFIFQDINFSDDLWPDYILSWNKERVLKKMNYNIKNKDKYFYSVEELTKFLITYNFQTFKKEIFLEDWLIYAIIIPLNQFIVNIKNSVNDFNNPIQVYEQLVEYFLDGITEEDKVKEIKFVSEKLSQYWKNLS